MTDCSVIIPTFNRAPVLRRCLDALAAQTAADRLNVVIADDGSTDGTSDMVTAWAAAAALPVRYFRQENAGANAARNAAIRMAQSPLLLIINDDTIAVPDLAAIHLALHTAHPEPQVAVLGRMTISPELPPSVFSALHHDASFKPFAGRTELGWDAFFTCNLSVKRDFLLAHGLFDEQLRWHEDIELGERLAAHGLRLLYAEAALGWHHHRLTEADYLRIAAREGRSLVQWHRRRAAAGQADNDLLRAALTPALRHRLADLALNPWTLPAARLAARGASRLAPPAGRALYAKIFQQAKRKAVRHELAEPS